MASTFELKPISREGIAAALEKAKRYRLLNEPHQAESICLDILAIDSTNQEAVVSLLLALTDQFPRKLQPAFDQARNLVPRLLGDYAKLYYEGLIFERRGKAHHLTGGPLSGAMAFEWISRAMEQYLRAERLRSSGDDDAILRWNSCARLIMRHEEIEAAPKDDPAEPVLE